MCASSSSWSRLGRRVNRALHAVAASRRRPVRTRLDRGGRSEKAIQEIGASPGKEEEEEAAATAAAACGAEKSNRHSLEPLKQAWPGPRGATALISHSPRAAGLTSLPLPVSLALTHSAGGLCSLSFFLGSPVPPFWLFGGI